MLKASCTWIAALALLAASVAAEAHGRRGGAVIGLHHGHQAHQGHPGHWRSGFWGGIGLGLGWWPYRYSYPYYDGERFGDPATYGPVFVTPSRQEPRAVSAVPSAPDPVFVARDGQDAARTESDRQACNRWVASQSAALADAEVFHRMSLSCMEGRGYAVR